jgi:hypothetical protein
MSNPTKKHVYDWAREKNKNKKKQTLTERALFTCDNICSNVHYTRLSYKKPNSLLSEANNTTDHYTFPGSRSLAYHAYTLIQVISVRANIVLNCPRCNTSASIVHFSAI